MAEFAADFVHEHNVETASRAEDGLPPRPLGDHEVWATAHLCGLARRLKERFGEVLGRGEGRGRTAPTA